MANLSISNLAPATVGLDVSDKLSHFCLIGSDGDLLSEGRLRTREADILERFRPFGRCRVVLEVGAHSPWICRLLRAEGHEVIVANPRKFQLIRQSYQKTDRSDAELLARVGRADPRLLSPVEHRGEQEQADLAVVRSRSTLVAARTMLINQVRGSVKAVGGALRPCDAHYFHRHAPAQLPMALRPALLPLITAIETLTQQIQEMDRELKRIAEARYPQTNLLCQVNGVGPVTSLAFVLTIGDPHRFRKSRDVGPYLGLTPRQRQSGERSPQLRITKAGDTILRSLLVQSAHYTVGPFGKDSALRRWGLQRLERGGTNGKKRVLVALARKLAVLLHRIWVTGEAYEPLRQEGGAAAA